MAPKALALAIAIRAILLTHPEHARTLADELVALLEDGSAIATSSRETSPARESQVRPVELVDPTDDHRAGDLHQLPLFGDHDRFRAPPEHDDRPDPCSGGDPSSSSDLDLLPKGKKKSDRVTVEPDEPIEPAFRRIFDEVAAARQVALPPVEIVWSDFVDWLVDRKRAYASRAGLKRRWRQWVLMERPVPSETQPAPSARQSGPGLAPARTEAAQLELERQERERAPRELAIVEAARLASLFAPPPMPRSMSA